jgi:hypothetical protein
MRCSHVVITIGIKLIKRSAEYADRFLLTQAQMNVNESIAIHSWLNVWFANATFKRCN